VIGGDSTNGRLESQAQAGEARRLSQRAGALGIAGAVRFLGPVAHEDLATYYSLADVTVVPSFTESFGLVALESQACGTPVIASQVGGLALLVKDGVTGFTIAGRSEQEFAARIAQVLDDRALQRELGRRGRLWAQSYTWERTGTRLARLYAEQALRVAEPVS
jgi:D-inositol-3-phosphate glycosyltransferase